MASLVQRRDKRADIDNRRQYLQLFACQGNPMLPMIFGEDVAGRVPGIQAMCVAPEGVTGAGDGICDVQKLMTCSHGPGGAWSELEAECGLGRCLLASKEQQVEALRQILAREV